MHAKTVMHQPGDIGQNMSLRHGISQGVKAHLQTRITSLKLAFLRHGLEKAFIVTLYLEISQGIKTRFEPKS